MDGACRGGGVLRRIFSKMILQRRGGVKTDQIGKGNKPRKVLVVELFMKIATYSIVAVEVASVVFDFRMWRYPTLGLA